MTKQFLSTYCVPITARTSTFMVDKKGGYVQNMFVGKQAKVQTNVQMYSSV